MATVEEYVEMLRPMGVGVAKQLGVDLTWSAKELRVVIMTTTVGFALVCKILEDAGIMTPETLNAYLAGALTIDWPNQPDNPTPPMDVPPEVTP